MSIFKKRPHKKKSNFKSLVTSKGKNLKNTKRIYKIKFTIPKTCDIIITKTNEFTQFHFISNLYFSKISFFNKNISNFYISSNKILILNFLGHGLYFKHGLILFKKFLSVLYRLLGEKLGVNDFIHRMCARVGLNKDLSDDDERSLYLNTMYHTWSYFFPRSGRTYRMRFGFVGFGIGKLKKRKFVFVGTDKIFLQRSRLPLYNIWPLNIFTQKGFFLHFHKRIGKYSVKERSYR